jgi:NTP pyrophosphatase (non-canonical NTP hydrolase)
MLEQQHIDGSVEYYSDDGSRIAEKQDAARPPGPMFLGDDLNALAADVHAQNLEAGWWDDWLDDKTARHETAMMLVISELAEAMEGDRKGLWDDHLPHHQMFDVELADAAIRLLDLAGAYEMDLGAAPGKAHEFAASRHREKTPPEKLRAVIKKACRAATRETEVLIALSGVFGIALTRRLNLLPIIAEKRAYNARRADHKLENRAAANGKKY